VEHPNPDRYGGQRIFVVRRDLCEEKTGLFPPPKDILFTCSCPEWASMCKHMAAVLYGIGARLDHQPELLFTLRRVEAPRFSRATICRRCSASR